MSLKARTLPTIRSIHALLISFLLPSHITTTELTGQGHLKTEIVVKKLNNFPSVENKKILNKTYDCDWTFLARHCKQVVPEDEVTGGRYMSRRYTIPARLGWTFHPSLDLISLCLFTEAECAPSRSVGQKRKAEKLPLLLKAAPNSGPKTLNGLWDSELREPIKARKIAIH